MAERVDVPTIARERLARWLEYLVTHHATPLLLVGIGHDDTPGELHILTVDNDEVTPVVLAGFLRFALRELEAGRG